MQGAEDGKAGADRGFVVDEAALGVLWVGGSEDGCPEGEGAGEGFFVRGDDVDAGFEERKVVVCNVLVAGVVDEDAFSGCLGGAGEEVVEDFLGG